MDKSLDSLPFEMTVYIMSFLPVTDLLRLAPTCRVFCNAISIVYNHRHRSQLEACVRSHAQGTHSMNYMKVTQALFNDYKFVLGTWKVVNTCYGGIVSVKFDGFKFVGTRYFLPPSPHVLQPLRPTKLFVVQVDNMGECQCVCYRGFNGPHMSTIEQTKSGGFKLCCSDPEQHFHKDGEKVEFSIWLCDELGMQKNSKELHLMSPLHCRKFEALRIHEKAMECSRLVVPPYKENAVIQPGLFKGTYGDHGLELVLLTYDDDNNTALVTKITGDPNVPAGKVTVTADLTQAMVLDEGQQYDLESVAVVEPSNDVVVPFVQPFRLPHGFFERVDRIPTTCIARYQSQGQIAAAGYYNPMFVDGHWVVFDADTFGHVWKFLHSFSLYSRVTEAFT